MCTIFCSVSLPRETKQNQTNEGVRDFQWNGMHAEFVWINYRGDFDFGGVNFGNSKSNCKTLRFPLGANIFGVVDDCCALHGMALVALTVIGDRDDILLFVSALVGSLIILTVDWLLLAARGVGVWGGDVHSCIAWLRVRNLPLPLFCVEIWGWSWCQFTKYRTTLGATQSLNSTPLIVYSNYNKQILHLLFACPMSCWYCYEVVIVAAVTF